MATITTDTFLDSAARTAGEAMTINGGRLTVRTDTRRHANAPASMNGSLGSVSISATLGGEYVIDGRNVRWLEFSGGGGTVPAIGASITQGGVSGYLLGVWTDYSSAPLAAGAGMPSTGYLKFREVTGGTYSAGALTGITASAVGADVLGWIEVVHDQAAAFTVPRLGKMTVRGGWFELGVTSGTAQQVVQVPTNGGGAGTRVPAVWIETAPASGVFEQYPAVFATYWLAANFDADDRSKFVQNMGSGQIRIGGDGTTAFGYVPPAGCRIRIPNVLGRQCTTAARATNAAPNATLGTRPDWVTTSAGDIDLEYLAADWYHIFASAYRVRIVHCATMDNVAISNVASPLEIEDYVVGGLNQAAGLLAITNCSLGGVLTDVTVFRGESASNGHCLSLTGVSNIELTRVRAGVITYARSSGAAVLSQCRNVLVQSCTLFAVPLSIVTCANVRVESHTDVDRIKGTTIATNPQYAVVCTVSCDNIVVDGLSLGGYTNVHPYSGLFNASNCSNLTFRNAGTQASPIGGATNAPAYVFLDSGNNDGVRVQRCALTATRTGVYLLVNTSKNITVENCYGTTGAVVTAGINSLARGIRATSNSTTGSASVYGTHWFDMFDGDTTGRIWLALNEPTASTADQIQTTFGAGAGFTSGGQVSMPNAGDELIATMPYFAVGHTGLANAALTVTGTNPGNFTIEYAIDTGDGFGTYQLATGANLSAETVSAVDGFRLRLRITTATANATNALTYVRLTTTTTLAAQQGNLYPLDYANISLSGLEAGSRVQLYDVTNDEELFNETTATGNVVYSAPFSGTFTLRVRAMYADDTSAKKWVEFSESVGASGLTRAIAQEDDAVYAANGIDGATVAGITISDGPMLVSVNTGTVSWPEIYAYETHWLTTEEGIRDEARFIEAVDPANYRLSEFRVRNTGAGPLVITGGYGVDADSGAAIDVIDTTGGTVIASPEHVVAYATSGGAGPTAGSIATAVRSAIAPDLTVINDGVQLASLLVPHTTGL
jgi:hypothetical protein